MRELMGRAIESVLDQTYRDFGLLVVDRGSTDGSRDIESQYRFDRRFNYIYQDNCGLSAVRNTGIRTSKGKYIGLLDADDSWLPHKLASQVGSMEKHQEIWLIYSDLYFFDVDLIWTIETFKERGGYKLPTGFVFQQLRLDNFISSPTPMVSRKTLEDVGFLDETLPTCEDWDLWLRISAWNPILLIGKPLDIYSV
jgi:glycosyltransferase involved in cell wall biosynthesis